jgi:hypothetical protein
MLPRPLLYFLVVLISVGWAVNLAVELISEGAGDPAVNGIFAIVVGALFAFSRRNGKNPGSGGDPE